MKLREIANYLSSVDIVNYIKLNYFSKKHIHINNKGKLIPNRASCFYFEEDSRMELCGRFSVNSLLPTGAKKESLIRLDKNSKIVVKGDFSIHYNADIRVFEGGELTLGSGYININSIIRCKNKITIGHNVAIAHNVFIIDTDAHSIQYENYEKSTPVIIGNNVWIGANSTILKGVTIGDGAIVAAGSVVTRSVKDKTLVAGAPARVIKEGMSWSI